MSFQNWSDARIMRRLSTLEVLMSRTRDTELLKIYNKCFQVLIDEQVRRDVDKAEALRELETMRINGR